MSFADGRALMAIHAHPDDETITMGGTLARYSAEGVRTILVTCTTGDLGEIRGESARERDAATVRRQELMAAARTLGVSRVVELGYSDSGMAGLPENHRAGAFFGAHIGDAATKVLNIIQQERPQVLVSYDDTGGYGHPDHVKAHQVAVAAYERCPSGVRPQRLYFIRFPRTWSREFVEALRRAGIDAPASAASGADAGPAVTEIGVPDELVTTVIDVGKYVPIKLAALARHASQMPPEHFLRRMPLELAKRVWAYEYFSLERDESLCGLRLSEVATTHQLEESPRAVDRAALETDLFAGLS
jgi:LmbE family N-acetylglucosaminyl deacetylase